MLKRFIDILLSGVGILIALPFFPLLAFLIKLDSKGPVFYLCDRIGKDGKPFKMFKFRTMYEVPGQPGSNVSPEGDPRVTPLGRLLRRTKLNELPQLINILKGEMAFVGPRPEAPDLAALYPPYARALFAVKPGLVGPNQILGRNEEEWYPAGVDPDQYYIETILPKKLPIDLEYIRQSSTLTDLKYIALGVKETLFKVLKWDFVLQNRSQICLLLADLVLSLAAFALAHVLRFGEFSTRDDLIIFLQLLPAVVLVRMPCFLYAGLYSTLIRYLSLHDMINVLKGVSAGSVLLVSLTFLSNFRAFSRLVFLLDWLCLVFLMCALRAALRLYWDRYSTSRDGNRRRVLIFGAGDAGALAYRSIMAEKNTAFDVVGFLDDDPAKRHKTLYGKRVLGNRFTLETVVKLYHVHDIMLAIASAPSHEVGKIKQACQHAGVSYKVFPTLTPGARSGKGSWRDGLHGELLTLQDIQMQDIQMQDIQMDADAVRQILQGKRVLLTGACGELGVELCRQILCCGPEQLVIMDRYEAYLTELVSRLHNVFPDENIVPVLYPSTREEKIADIFLEHHPHVVFHTTMRKYSPLSDIPVPVNEVLRVNYLSTFELAKQADNAHCEYFVMLSSLEAAKHDSFISESLRAAEISLQQFFASQPTRLVVVRLGDIIENRGGIWAQIEKQIVHREPVTLPHPDVKYHFLSKQAAAHFILQALVLTEMNPPEEGIFICNQEATVSLQEVADQLAMHHGVELGADLPVRFLNGHRHNDVSTSIPVPPRVDQRLVPTAHAGIHRLLDFPVSDSAEFPAAINRLINLQEHDFEQTAWEKSTRILLHLESAP
jgi:FlaA1/EpsC-like NDP-sugar epimerase/lipopolysaccharide/colanic/teichoic acid biosynthesis glycosyltransferase